MLTIVKNDLILSRLRRRYGIKGFSTVARDKWDVVFARRDFCYLIENSRLKPLLRTNAVLQKPLLSTNAVLL